jgi:DNA-binding GntR family transcriptional regulator
MYDNTILVVKERLFDTIWQLKENFMIKRDTLTSRVFDYLMERIKSGQVKPGEKFPTEKELTETLA